MPEADPLSVPLEFFLRFSSWGVKLANLPCVIYRFVHGEADPAHLALIPNDLLHKVIPGGYRGWLFPGEYLRSSEQQLASDPVCVLPFVQKQRGHRALEQLLPRGHP